jgi:hypothetical protein
MNSRNGSFGLALFCCLWLIVFLFAGSASGAAQPGQAATNAVRVALMTFTTGDNSYRSSQAADDLAAALQAELSARSEFVWVERVDLKAVERELELSELGLPDATGALRRGRFTAADWIVTGAFAIHTNGQWKLTVEVIDVRRADLLAARTAELSRTAHPTLKSALSQLGTITAETRESLRLASRRWEAVGSRRAVALFMMMNAEADEIESRVAFALENPGEGETPLRALRLARKEQSFGENELILLGLTRENPEAWEKLADAYVWGWVTVRPGQAEGVLPSPHWIPVLEANVWQHRHQARAISIDGEPVRSPDAALPQAEQLASRLDRELRAALKSSDQEKVPGNVRAQMAQSLLDRALTWGAGSRWAARREQTVRASNEKMEQQIRLLETACFFDPANQQAAELLLRMRWNPGSAGHSFWSYFHGSEAWGHHVERFGFSTNLWKGTSLEVDPASLKEAYVLSAFRLVEQSRLGNKEDYDFPRDMSGHVARKWLSGFTSELVKRALKTLDEPTTRSLAWPILVDGLTGNPKQLMMVEPSLRRQAIEALWPALLERIPPGSRQQDFPELCESVSAAYADVGRKGLEKNLLRLLDKPKSTNMPAPVRLPRASETGPAQPRFPRPSTNQ